ncbi:MAG TPA: sigma-70 family RNA polymerase sigma factor [Pontibacter sp.]
METCTELTSDEALWSAIVANDRAAFDCLFKRYWSRIFTTAFRHLKDKDACTEVVHDIFLNIWLKRDQLQIVSFPNYLQAAARYHVYKRLKQLKEAPVEFTENWEKHSQAASMNMGAELLRTQELDEKVSLCLEKLPQRCREIFVLSRNSHLSNEEIAEKLGISRRTVENQITYALQHLRESLRDISCITILLWYISG